MAHSSTDTPPRSCTRRCFLKHSSMAVSALAVTRLAAGHAVHAAGSDVLRVGLIGCGGRGSGAVVNALTADPQARLMAMADAFAWRIDESLKNLLVLKPGQIDVPPERQFVGLESYRQLLLMRCRRGAHYRSLPFHADLPPGRD